MDRSDTDIKRYLIGIMTKTMPLEDIPADAIPEVEAVLSKMGDMLAAAPANDETTMKGDDDKESVLFSQGGQWHIKPKTPAAPKENTLDYSSFNKPKVVSDEGAQTIDYSGKEPKVSGPQWKSSDMIGGSKTKQLPSSSKGALKRQRIKDAVDRGSVIDDRPKR